MKFILIILIFLYNSSFGQTNQQQQIVKKGFYWKVDDRKLKWKDLHIELNKVPATALHGKKAQSSRKVAVVGYLSSMSFYVLDRIIKERNSDSITFFNIASLISGAVGISFMIKSILHTKKAIRIYNNY